MAKYYSEKFPELIIPFRKLVMCPACGQLKRLGVGGDFSPIRFANKIYITDDPERIKHLDEGIGNGEYYKKVEDDFIPPVSEPKIVDGYRSTETTVKHRKPGRLEK